MIQQAHLQMYPKELKRGSQGVSAPPCPWEHYSYQPRYGNDQNVQWLINKKIKCDIQWNAYLFYYKYWNTTICDNIDELEDIMLSEVSQIHEDK